MNRAKLRECTFQLLYCNEFYNSDEMEKQHELFWDDYIECSDEEKEYVKLRVDAIADNIREIDAKINEVAIGWTTDRMNKVDLSIMRLAYYEMKIDDNIPSKVAVDQAIELAKKFGSETSPSFINGILSKFF